MSERMTDAALDSHNSADSIGNAACVSNREADAALADAVALLHKVAKSDVMSDRSGVMFVHLAIDRDVIDDINALLAASQSATGGA